MHSQPSQQVELLLLSYIILIYLLFHIYYYIISKSFYFINQFVYFILGSAIKEMQINHVCVVYHEYILSNVPLILFVKFAIRSYYRINLKHGPINW